MRLTTGTALGPYQIEALVGAGGMGEVYRAHDSRLGRAVAVKLLPALFASDPERLGRFEREARTLASLNHPNIAQVYGLEESNGVRGLVMELVEGPTLAEVIASGSGPGFDSPPPASAGPRPIPLADALRIARQIAAALDAAHEKGIVHRDLKPANIKLTPDGTVKVLDFGLAKLNAAAEADGSAAGDVANSPTLTSPAMTGAGIMLGTAAYMAPEQARGLPVDKRADIWAFGLVLFEMLTGRPTFGGETVSDVIAAVLRADPDWSALPPETPNWVRRLLRHCLDRDPRHRLRDIGDAIVEIDEASADGTPQPAVHAPPTRGRWWRYAAFAGGIALLSAAAFLVGRQQTPVSSSLLRVDVMLAEDPLFTDIGPSFDVAPDGRLLVYVTGTSAGGRQLFVRPLNQLAGRKLVDSTGVVSAPYHPFFSPDGQWVGYVTTAELRKVPLHGGTSLTLAPVNRSRGATWLPDGTIVFASSTNTGLSRVSANGGAPEAVTELNPAQEEASHRWPHALPDGNTILFVSHTRVGGSFGDAVIEAVDLRTRQRKVLQRGGTAPRYIASGHLVFVREGVLFAASFDARRVEVTGNAVPIVQDVRWDRVDGGAQVAFSETGLLAYVRGATPTPTYPVVWVDREGKTAPLLGEAGTYANPRLSPDGRVLSLTVWKDRNWDIWLYDLQREVFTRLTFHEAADTEQIWSPDGEFIAFSSDRDGRDQLYRKRWDGSGAEERITSTDSHLWPSSWSANGTLLAVDGGFDLFTVSLADRTVQPFLEEPHHERDGVFSPDGRWVAYTSRESGRSEVYVRPFVASGGRWQVSDSGGAFPRWSRDGRELFYRTDDGVMVAAVEVVGNGLRTGRARPVIRGDFLGGLEGLNIGGFAFPDYDVSADGRRLVMFPRTSAEADPRTAIVTLVTGGFEELTGRAGGGR